MTDFATNDLALAIAHHLLIFSLAGVLAFEIGAIRSNMTGQDIRRVGRVAKATTSVEVEVGPPVAGPAPETLPLLSLTTGQGKAERPVDRGVAMPDEALHVPLLRLALGAHVGAVGAPGK